MKRYHLLFCVLTLAAFGLCACTETGSSPETEPFPIFPNIVPSNDESESAGQNEDQNEIADNTDVQNENSDETIDNTDINTDNTDKNIENDENTREEQPENDEPENDEPENEQPGTHAPEINDNNDVHDDIEPQIPVYPDGIEMKGVTAYRVAPKINGKKKIADQFKAFDVKNADTSTLFNVRIAEIANPEVHKTVMFITSGQKSPIGDHPNGLTGQGPDWDEDCDNVSCPNITLDKQSLSMKLRALNWFPEETTYLALGIDNNFDYTLGSSKRESIVAGFLAWLEESITDDTENIVLAGSSRGGCLVLQIAQALRNNPEYDDIEIYVSSFDGVCIKGSEFGTTSKKVDNPVRFSGTFYGGWATDINNNYPNKEHLNIYHISGGQEVVALIGVRTFSAYEGTKPPSKGTDIDWGWYKQTWVPWKHLEIGNPYLKPDKKDIPQVVSETIDSQLYWLENKLNHFDETDQTN